MKKIIGFLLITLFTQQNTKAQSFNIPYLQDNRYQLINQDGHKVLSKSYISLRWIANKYFIGTNTISANDTLIVNNEHYLRYSYDGILHTDLIYEQKVIIENSPFSQFEIYNDNIIVGKSAAWRQVKNTKELEKYHIKKEHQSIVFNKDGQQILPYGCMNIGSIFPLGNPKDSSHYYFLAYKNDQQISLIVYSTKEKKVIQTLFDNSIKINDLNIWKSSKSEVRSYEFEIVSANNVTEKVTLLFDGKKFTKAKNVVVEVRKNNMPTEGRASDVSFPLGDMDLKAVSGPAEGDGFRNSSNPSTTKDVTLYTIIRDSVFQFQNSFQYNKAQLIGISNQETKYILPYNNSHSETVLIKKKDLYALLNSKQQTPFQYKNAEYIDNKYIKIQETNNKYGVVNQQFGEVLPVIYDSILLDRQSISFSAVGQHIYTGQNKFGPPITNFKNWGTYASAFKDGKVSLYNHNFQPYYAEPFHAFYKNNGGNIVAPQQSTNYIALTDAGYQLIPNFMTKSNASLIGTFPGLPLYFYDNYYGVKELKIYGVYDKDLKFMGLYTENGRKLEAK